jgi:hypothetical protein
MGGSLKAAGFGDGRECQEQAKHVLGPLNDYGRAQPHPATLSSLRKQGSKNVAEDWIPAFAGMTYYRYEKE